MSINRNFFCHVDSVRLSCMASYDFLYALPIDEELYNYLKLFLLILYLDYTFPTMIITMMKKNL